MTQIRLANSLTADQCGHSTEARKQRVVPLNLSEKNQHLTQISLKIRKISMFLYFFLPPQNVLVNIF